MHSGTWMNLKDIMLRERNQSRKATYSFIFMPFRKQKNYRGQKSEQRVPGACTGKRTWGHVWGVGNLCLTYGCSYTTVYLCQTQTVSLKGWVLLSIRTLKYVSVSSNPPFSRWGSDLLQQVWVGRTGLAPVLGQKRAETVASSHLTSQVGLNLHLSAARGWLFKTHCAALLITLLTCGWFMGV